MKWYKRPDGDFVVMDNRLWVGEEIVAVPFETDNAIALRVVEELEPGVFRLKPHQSSCPPERYPGPQISWNA